MTSDEKDHSKNKTGTRASRREAGYRMLAEGVSNSQIARTLGISRRTVIYWSNIYKAKENGKG